MYDWKKQTCEAICPGPLTWINGRCLRPISAVAALPPPPPSLCVQTSADDLIDIYTRHPDSSVTYTDEYIELSVISGGERYCHSCRWAELSRSAVDVDNDILSVKDSELTVRKPLYHMDGDSAVRVCNVTVAAVFDRPCQEGDVTRDEFSRLYNSLSEYNSNAAWYTHRDIRVLLNESLYCYPCHWSSAPRSDVTPERNGYEIQGHMYFKPYYYSLNSTDNSNDSGLMFCGVAGANSSKQTTLELICLSVGETVVSLVTVSLSIAFLTVMLVVYIILPALHNTPGYLVLSQVAYGLAALSQILHDDSYHHCASLVPQATSLLLAYAFFLIRLAADGSSTGCYIVAVLTHYFFLVSYFLSFVFATDVIQTITALYTVNQKSKSKIIR